MKDIVLIGMGGHAKSVVDSIEGKEEYNIAGFVEQEMNQDAVYRNYSVIGTDDDLGKLYAEGIRNAFITIGYMGHSDIRNRLYYRLKDIGYNIPVIIDGSAVIASDAIIGEGSYIGKAAVINSDAQIGKMCIINTKCLIEHECIVGDYSHISVAAVLCGQTVVGSNALVGANAVVLQQRRIGDYAIVGAGAAVRRNVYNNQVIK